MWRTALRSTAAASALLAVVVLLHAARRPRYGGELRIETQASFASVDQAPEQIADEVFETLVRLDDRGEPQPWLAVSWSHDVARKRWVFLPRPNVTLHNGATWTPEAGMVAVADDQPIENILLDLSQQRRAIVVRLPDGSRIGTGPFRVARFEAGKTVSLAAHENYWRGRTYLDTVEIAMGRALKDQAQDLEVGKADVVEIPVTDIRRLKQRGTSVATTQPMETLALRFEGERAGATLREGVALAIDRVAIHNVLLQRQGEVSGALLPRWLSGYSFVFPAERNVSRARQLATGSPPLAFAYDSQDAVVRAIAERVAVNASEAGITLRPVTGAPDLRLMRLAVASRDSMAALADLASTLKLRLPESPPGPYEAEAALLEGYRVIPLVHLPRAWALAPRVRDWGRLEDVWLDAGERVP